MTSICTLEPSSTRIFHRMRGIESIFRVAEKTIFMVVKSFY